MMDYDQFQRPPLPQPMRAQLRDAFSLLPRRAYAAQLLIADLQTGSTRIYLAARDEGTGAWKVVGPGGEWAGPQPVKWFGFGKVWLAPLPRT